MIRVRGCFHVQKRPMPGAQLARGGVSSYVVRFPFSAFLFSSFVFIFVGRILAFGFLVTGEQNKGGCP